MRNQQRRKVGIMEIKKIALFDTKPYDRESFDRQNNGRYDIKYFETRLTLAALPLANLDAYFAGAPLENEICYRCLGTGGSAKSNCPRRANGRCH